MSPAALKPQSIVPSRLWPSSSTVSFCTQFCGAPSTMLPATIEFRKVVGELMNTPPPESSPEALFPAIVTCLNGEVSFTKIPPPWLCGKAAFGNAGLATLPDTVTLVMSTGSLANIPPPWPPLKVPPVPSAVFPLTSEFVMVTGSSAKMPPPCPPKSGWDNAVFPTTATWSRFICVPSKKMPPPCPDALGSSPGATPPVIVRCDTFTLPSNASSTRDWPPASRVVSRALCPTMFMVSLLTFVNSSPLVST